MKFARRKPTAGAPVDRTLPAPSGTAVAAFAGILDGRSLWVAVADRPGTLTLRDRASGEVLTLPAAGVDEQPGYASARLDLTAVAALPDDAELDVVLVPPGGPVEPLWISAERSIPPSPPHPEVTAHLSVHRAGDGTVRVRRRSLPRAHGLEAVSADAGTLHLVLRGTGSTLGLLADGGSGTAEPPLAKAATRPHHLDPGLLTVDLDVELVAALAPQMTRVVLGEPGAWLPVRRPDTDLAEPGKGAPLPTLHDPVGGEPRLRLRWSNEALLLARVLDDAAKPGGGGR